MRHEAVAAWARAWHGDARVPGELLLACLGAALVLCLWRPAWSRVRYGVTLTHEAGHALVAWAVGRRLAQVRVERGSSGVTLSRGPARGPGVVATLLAGYPAPSFAGLALVGASVSGYPTLALLTALLAVLALALWVRSVVGWLVVLAGAALLCAALASAGVAVVAAPLLGSVLLLGGARDAVELGAARRATRSTDADLLAQQTRVPGLFWVQVFRAVCLLALAAAVWAAAVL